MLKGKTKVKKLAINKILVIMAIICTIFAVAIILLPLLSNGEIELLAKSASQMKENYATTETNTWDVSVNGDRSVAATLDENGLLTISGEGLMKNFLPPDTYNAVLENIPWYSVRNQIKSVKIKDGVTSIGACVFYECEQLTQIEIPDSVTRIGQSAFYQCSSLTSIEIPSGVISIGTFPFYNCGSLTSIEVEDDNTKYCDEDGVLYTKDKKKLIQYPVAKEGIEYEILSGVTNIEDSAFAHGSKLISIKIPDTVTTIGDFAFWGCSSLTSIEIPSGVTSIGTRIFSKCESLTSIEVDKNNTKYCDEYGVLYSKDKTKLIAYPAAKKSTEYEILSSVTTIGDPAFSVSNNLISISIPDNVTTIEDSAFWGCTNLKNIEIPSKVKTIGESAFEGCSSLTSIKIPSGVTKISARTFYECSSLTSIEIPTSVTTIEESAFKGCSNLTNIEIPSAVTKIGESAFRGCENLTNIVIPTKATSIGNEAFYGCSNITNVEIPSTVTSIGDSAFVGCKSLTSISVNTSNTKYSSEYGVLYSKDKTKLIAYPAAKEKTEYEILSSVTSIEESAFSGCSNLKSIKIPSGVASIGNGALVECRNLTSIEVEDDNTEYCDENGILYTKDKTKLIAYPAGKTEIEYTILSSITDIEEYAFNGCKNLKNIKVEENNTEYSSDNGVLYTKDKKQLIAYPAGKTEMYYEILNNTTDIADRAFLECNNLREVTIPNSVTKIGEKSFDKCTNLINLEIPSSVTSIGDWAFEGCVITNLVDITNNSIELPEILKRTLDVNDILSSHTGLALVNCTIEGSTIKIDEGASYAKIKVLYGELEGLTYVIFNNTWDVSAYQDGSIIASLTDNGTLTISGEGDMMSWEETEIIPWNEVKQLINNVKLEGEVTSIENYTFYGCNNLTSIKIPSKVTYIGENAFENSDDLTIICKNGTTAQTYAKENNINYIIIEGITPKTTASEIKANLKGEIQCEIVDLEGNTVTDTSTIGTGYKVKTADGEEYSIIVWGDFTGDGKISVAELAIASRVAAQAQELGEEQKRVLDISGDGEVKITDLAAISRLATE